MDTNAFVIALASTILAALTLLREHVRTSAERRQAELHRCEDREDRDRSTRVELFLDFLQLSSRMRDAIVRIATTFAGGDVPAAIAQDRWSAALGEIEATKSLLQRCADKISLLEVTAVDEDVGAVLKELNAAVKAVQPQVSTDGQPRIDPTAFDAVNKAVHQAQSALRMSMRTAIGTSRGALDYSVR